MATNAEWAKRNVKLAGMFLVCGLVIPTSASSTICLCLSTRHGFPLRLLVYLLFDAVLTILNFVDFGIVVVSYFGFKHNRTWAPHLTHLWALAALALALSGAIMHSILLWIPADHFIKGFDRQSLLISLRLAVFGSFLSLVFIAFEAWKTSLHLRSENLSQFSDVKRIVMKCWAILTRSDQKRPEPD